MKRTLESDEAADAGSLARLASRRLTAEEWNDVADLCHEAAVACEIAYEDHKALAKKKAAEWFMNLAMKAHRNYVKAEAASASSDRIPGHKEGSE